MAFDGFVLNATIAELNCLIGGKIQKVYEPNNNEILLSIYANGLQYALSINVSSNFYSIYLTTTKKENPLIAPNFCMLLRKYLMNFKIANISTIGFERIVIIELSGNDENHIPITRKLVVELMGKHSNVLLLNEETKIIDSLKHFSVQNGATRNISPRYTYTFPTSTKIDIHDYLMLEKSLPKEETLSNFFANQFTGVSKTLIKYAIVHLKIEDYLSLENFHLLATHLLSLITNITQNQVKCTLFENDYTLTKCEKSQNLQVNFFLDDYYHQKMQEEQFLSYRNQLLNFILAKLKKISKKLATIDNKLKECEHLEDYQLYGELIASYLYQISNKHVSHITLENYYDNNQPIDIPLDITLSPSDNAKKYFKKYHKLKNTYTVVQGQKIEVEKEINYLESIVYEIQASQTIQELDAIYEEIQEAFSLSQKVSNKKQFKKKLKKDSKLSKPLQYEIQGFKVLIGKNNRQNDELTFKLANKDDLWFHVKDLHGSHVILITNGKIPSQEIINQCASLAAYYSKGSQSSNIPVDYTLIKYVKKPSKAKPGMVIYTNQKTVNVQPHPITNIS